MKSRTLLRVLMLALVDFALTNAAPAAAREKRTVLPGIIWGTGTRFDGHRQRLVERHRG